MNDSKSHLPLVHIRQVADAVLDVARRDGVRVSVVIVDDKGYELVLLRDGAAWLTTGVARSKAVTSALLGMPTTRYREVAEANPALVGLIDAQTHQPTTTLGGGLPLMVDGRIVGGIGVSGAPTEEQDVEYAVAGVALFELL